MVLVNVYHGAGAVHPKQIEADTVAALLEVLVRTPGFGRGSVRTADNVLAADAPLPQPTTPGGTVTLTFIPNTGSSGGGEAAAPVAKMVRRPVESPSQFARYSVWYAAQMEACTTTRLQKPAGDGSSGFKQPMSVSLIDPVLASISEAFKGRGRHGEPPHHNDLATVATLTCMASHFEYKGERRDKFVDIMNEYLGGVRGAGYLAVNSIAGHDTDGTVLVKGMPTVILEVKNHIGEGGDPCTEGQDDYRHYLMDRAATAHTRGIVRETPCPCLLIELMGPELRVSALASTCDTQVICQPLTSRLHLYDMFNSDWQHMLKMAKVVRALKFGAEELKKFYESADQSFGDHPAELRSSTWRAPKRHCYPAPLDQSKAVERNPSLSLPYPLRPGWEHQFGSMVAGTRPEPLQQQHALLYRCQRPGDAHSRLVKILQHGSYGEGVQRAWAQQGLAPEVYAVTPLPDGCSMVEMEELRNEDGWVSVAGLPMSKRSAQLFEAVKDALQQAHRVEVSAGKCGVHGDARGANVLVCLPAVDQPLALGQEQQASGQSGEQQRSLPSQGVVQHQRPPAPGIKVRFVDFDWAGVADEAELPPWAVPRRGLPSDRKLTRDYDFAVWEQTWLRDNTIDAGDDE